MSLLTSLLPTVSPQSKLETTPANDKLPSIAPRYQIAETPEAYALTVDLPGVSKDGLELSVDHEQIRVFGRRAWLQPATWTALHRETREAHYELVLEHGRAIDFAKITADLRDGVLRVALPKTEALKPRKIAVA